MIELQIEGVEGPLEQKKDFFIVTDDADAEMAEMADTLNEYFDGEDVAFVSAIEEATKNEDGVFKIQIADEDVADVTEALGERWEQIEETMSSFRETMIHKAESGG